MYVNSQVKIQKSEVLEEYTGYENLNRKNRPFQNGFTITRIMMPIISTVGTSFIRR